MKEKLKILSIPIALFTVEYFLGVQNETDLTGLVALVTPIIILAIVMFFPRKETLNLWWYFSVLFWGLFLALILTSDTSGGGLDVGLGGVGMALYFLSWFYFFFSLVIIAVKSYKLRGK